MSFFGLATIVNFDLVVVLEDGELVEIGDPQLLLKNEFSRFAKLANSQGVAI